MCKIEKKEEKRKEPCTDEIFFSTHETFSVCFLQSMIHRNVSKYLFIISHEGDLTKIFYAKKKIWVDNSKFRVKMSHCTVQI